MSKEKRYRYIPEGTPGRHAQPVEDVSFDSQRKIITFESLGEPLEFEKGKRTRVPVWAMRSGRARLVEQGPDGTFVYPLGQLQDHAEALDSTIFLDGKQQKSVTAVGRLLMRGSEFIRFDMGGAKELSRSILDEVSGVFSRSDNWTQLNVGILRLDQPQLGFLRRALTRIDEGNYSMTPENNAMISNVDSDTLGSIRGTVEARYQSLAAIYARGEMSKILDSGTLTAVFKDLKVIEGDDVIYRRRAAIWIRSHYEEACPIAEVSSKYAVDKLVKALDDPDEVVRENCAFSLGHLKSQRAIAPLSKMAFEDENRVIRSAACSALGMISSPATVPPLISCLEDGDINVRTEASKALMAKSSPEEALAVAQVGLGSDIAIVREKSAKILKAIVAKNYKNTDFVEVIDSIAKRADEVLLGEENHWVRQHLLLMKAMLP